MPCESCSRKKESFSKLEQLNSLKNQMLGTAAHDIRGPIGSIKTASEFLLKRDLSDTKRESLQKMIANSSKDLLELLENLLDVSAIESGHVHLEYSEFELKAFLQERMAVYEYAHNKRLTITFDLVELTVQADSLKLKQVVDNLLTNAIKFSPMDTVITIKTTLFRQDQQDWLMLSVSDSGPWYS